TLFRSRVVLVRRLNPTGRTARFPQRQLLAGDLRAERARRAALSEHRSEPSVDGAVGNDETITRVLGTHTVRHDRRVADFYVICQMETTIVEAERLVCERFDELVCFALEVRIVDVVPRDGEQYELPVSLVLNHRWLDRFG